MKVFHGIICVSVAALLLIAGVAIADDATENTFYETRIRPLFETHCYECHGTENQEGQLRLDRVGHILQGGVSGKSIVPGNPNGSLLITAVRQSSDDLQMPPEGKLTATQIADLVQWVEAGANMPGASEIKLTATNHAEWQERSNHWALQGPIAPEFPDVKGQDWIETSIDHFILSRLEHAGIQPAARADRRTLIRRATFDLIGLPPTPDEINAFLGDESPKAFAKVVDRLLASPHYGERWGRHWLDIARYADSNGLDENVAHGNAWRYRDWVIQSLNRDLPYDQFVSLQLAGDLFSATDAVQRNRQLIATGFLSLGPKVLAEVDEQKMEMDIIDEQIDTVGRSLLGLTLGCARCHDHKFDPISTKDYYALAGVFKSTHSMDSYKKLARWHEHELFSEEHAQGKAQHEAELAAKRRQVEELIAIATATLQRELEEGSALPAMPEESFPLETQEQLQALREAVATLEKNAPVAPTAMGVKEREEQANVAVHIRGSHLTQGDIVPRGFPAAVASDSHMPISEEQSGRRELAQWLTSPNHPLTSRVMVNRVWRWHFGRGLVETTDNFGLQGAIPSHPKLLDHLAVAFSRDWSLKRLHRQIMLSATYQTSSNVSADAKQADPENRLLSHTSLRRLEAEEIRDAMLAVSGTLDREQGGPAIAAKNRAFIFDHTSKDETSYHKFRRSVYLPVIRNHLFEAFSLFDYNDASVPVGNRPTSTVASQALYLINSSEVIDHSQAFAQRLQGTPSQSDANRIETMYLLALGREANDREIRRALQYIESTTQASSREKAWQLLCQTILVSNEFFYIR